MGLQRIISIFFFLFLSQSALAQGTVFDKIEPEATVIDTGAFSGYTRYDLALFYLFIGAGEDNLKFNIVSKTSNAISFSYDNSFSDAMTLKPALFVNDAEKPEILLMIGIAAETSWGQELLFIQGEAVNYIGFLEYAVANKDDSSIAGYCKVYRKGKKIRIAMDPVPVIDYTSGERQVNGADLKIEINTAKMKLTVK